MNDVVDVFKALSDETRLRIVCLLLERECCVCEVMQALQISQTRASRNLNILYRAGFLKFRRDGLWSLYSVDRDGMGEHLVQAVGAVARALEGNPTVAGDRERLKRAERVGPGCASGPRARR